jgi:adenylosuccinate lyase
MIPRYANKDVDRIWANENKLRLWQETELAVIQARVSLGMLHKEDFRLIDSALRANVIDIDWWLAREEQTKHDLNAFLDERMRFLAPELQRHFHKDMTSYDTEEPAFAKMLSETLVVLGKFIGPVMGVLADMAKRYRYTIMNGRTHGQEAELQSFGKRCLTWRRGIQLSADAIEVAARGLGYSKLSGAIGNYRGLKPEVEAEALRILGLKPFYGATQIMPRELYASLAQAITQLVMSANKVALDIRLGARSGQPIYQEPFGKLQMGSSAMPHKKNTINCEQVEGMARMAQGYNQMILANLSTWEERAIEQSSVERVAWPDLFHVAIQALKVLHKVLSGLQVYPDNMMLEIVGSCGCYASSEAKEFLREVGAEHGLTSKDAYCIVQLAAFNAFEATQWQQNVRKYPCQNMQDMDVFLSDAISTSRCSAQRLSIQDIISKGTLEVSPQLNATREQVQLWNGILSKIFCDSATAERWDGIFKPSHLLAGEATLFEQLLV